MIGVSIIGDSGSTFGDTTYHRGRNQTPYIDIGDLTLMTTMNASFFLIKLEVFPDMK